MHNASTALKTAIDTEYDLRAIPRLVMEWNQNRYAGIQTVNNDPDDAANNPLLEEYPISSIVLPHRPKKGIIKARASVSIASSTTTGVWKRPGTVTRTTGEEGFVSADYEDTPGPERYYTVGTNGPYKYWSSYSPSVTTKNANNSYNIASVKPYVVYKRNAWTNKLVIGLENTWASPVDFVVRVTTNGTDWTTIATNPTIDENGRVILYRQGNGQWTKTVNYNNPTQIRGLRLEVTTVNKARAHVNVIELSARLERDLSEYLISYDTTFDMAESNFITPLGQSSANTASLVLSNHDHEFNNDDVSSLYYKLLDKNALCTLDLVYDLNSEPVREFTMWVDAFGNPANEELAVSCKDSAKIFQEEPVSPILLENVTIGEAVWRLCDLHGFTDYVYDKNDLDASTLIPYFWTSDEDSLWTALQKLAEATQTAIYFDEYNILRIQTRNAAFNSAKAPVWALETTDEVKPANVVEAEVLTEHEANVVTINYKETKPSDDNKGFPQMQVLWEPEGDFVLRSTQLVQSITADAMHMQVDSREVDVWPYDAIVNIEGELIKYRGKEYQYQNKQNQRVNVYIYSLDEKNNIDKNLTYEGRAYLNTWTGWLKIEERGYLWTTGRAHSVDIQNWVGRRTVVNSTAVTQSQAGISHDRKSSVMKVSTKSSNYSEIYTVTRGLEQDAHYATYGTRMRIPKAGAGKGMSGIVFCSGPADSGYFVDIIRSEILDEGTGALRNAHHELNFFVRHSSGAIQRSGGNGGKGVPILVAPDSWLDLDVDFNVDANGAHHFTIRVNGVVRMRHTLTGGRVAVSGRQGVYSRGACTTEFEYFYAMTGNPRNNSVENPDESTFFDRIKGDFSSTQFDREFVYGTRDANRRVGKTSVAYKQKYNQYFMDEFGPTVHEVREMELTFEKFPALHSRLYITNDSQAVVPEYNANPFGVKFVLANAARHNSVLNGEDLITRGKDNPLEQKMMIYGRLLQQADNKAYTVKNAKGVDINPIENEDDIRRRGRVNVEIDSKWIQTEAAAKALGDWILKNWSGGAEEVEAEIFGNPLLQLGDVVTLDYPKKNIHRDTHRFYVVAKGNTFDTGLSSKVVLRRVKI